MNAKAILIAAALLASTLALAQSYDPLTGQRYDPFGRPVPMRGQLFDQYGRPLPSVEQLCRQGQMAGGPMTEQCAAGNYRFNRKGERLVRYDFSKWGYNLLDLVTEATAARLDADSKYRAAYIKSHHIKELVEKAQAAAD